jgi:hypothetical protein
VLLALVDVDIGMVFVLNGFTAQGTPLMRGSHADRAVLVHVNGHDISGAYVQSLSEMARKDDSPLRIEAAG